MARRPNYGGEKRQKEIKKQKKRDEKAEKKRLKKEAAATGDLGDAAEGEDTELDAESPESESEPAAGRPYPAVQERP